MWNEIQRWAAMAGIGHKGEDDLNICIVKFRGHFFHCCHLHKNTHGYEETTRQQMAYTW